MGSEKPLGDIHDTGLWTLTSEITVDGCSPIRDIVVVKEKEGVLAEWNVQKICIQVKILPE